MERREERARLHDERAAGDLLDAARDAKPVQLAGRKRLENQKIEGPLKQRRAAA
jgi:hypothetical protein